MTTEGDVLRVAGEELTIYHLVKEGGENSSPPKGNAQSEAKTVVADKEKYWLIDGDAAVIIPKGWSVTQGLAAPIHIAAEYLKGALGFSILKELPADLEVSTVAEYATLKSEVLQENFPDFHPSEPKAGKIGDLPASFFQGPGTVQNMKGEIICMAIQGKEHMYLLLGILGEGSNQSSQKELMRVMRSFKEKS